MLNIFSSINTRITQLIAKIFNLEKVQLPCWLPVFIAIGILIGFNINPLNYWLLLSIIITSLVARYFIYNISINIIITSICAITIGLCAIQHRIKSIDSPIIANDNQFTYVIGTIDNITPLEHGYRVLLSKIYIPKLAKAKTPYKIRLTVKTDINNAKIGDRVKLSAMLNKPMQPFLPDSYNFARDAYFKQIGAVGYSLSNLKIIGTDNKSFQSKINSLRNHIQNRVNLAIGSYDGSIATALMLNEYSNIDKEVLKDLRATGLAHILSVSGMHLSLVAAIFFFSTRFILNCFEPIALHLHCKKIASFVSLLGSFAYLLISGMEVAAIRSFIMTSMIIVAIMIDRNSNPMRAIAFAATIILIITPENIIHPSFQMSFAAVLALIACFELFSKLKFDFAEFNLAQKILFYLLSLSLASLVAGLATMPFALYHFSQSSNYSILANLLAVPITSFCLMPLVVLTFLLYPLHLEILSLYPMKFGIELMLKISHYIAHLPHSVTAFAKITDINLLIIVFGMLWFCIWLSKIRFIGVIIILCGILSQSFVKQPDIFIDWDSKIIAVLNQRHQLIFLTKPLAKFKKQLLMNQLGVSESFRYQESDDLQCQNDLCLFSKDDYQVRIDLKIPSIEISKAEKVPKMIQNETGVSLIRINN